MYMENKCNRNGSIDALRIIMALFVVTNHSMVFDKLTHDVLAMAVPVFYIITGYFLGGHDYDRECKIVKRQLIKITRILLWSYLLYAIFHVIYCQISGKHMMFNLSTLWTCCNNFGDPLWYLHTYAYMLLCVILMHKCQFHMSKLIKPTTIISIILSAYILSHVECIPELIKRVYCHAFAFVIVGQSLKQYEHIWKTHLKKWHLIVCLFGLATIGVLNGIYLIDRMTYSIVTWLLAMNALMLFCKLNIQNKHWLAKLGREYSLYVYIFHWMFVVILTPISYHYPPYIRLLYPIILFAITLLFSVVYKRIYNLLFKC